jgi:hypothetical protein
MSILGWLSVTFMCVYIIALGERRTFADFIIFMAVMSGWLWMAVMWPTRPTEQRDAAVLAV